MMTAAGIGAAAAGVFHLATHAFFKALLFLGAGSVIHSLRDPNGQDPLGLEFDPNDIRLMGGLKDRLPKTFWAYLIGALALAGIPPLAGFWSKDEIVLEAFLKGLERGQTSAAWPFQAAFVCLLAAAFLTAFYMTRQVD
jgi:NADH-quinone oxidoreductase subunit L